MGDVLTVLLSHGRDLGFGPKPSCADVCQSAFRSMKSVLRMESVHHRAERRFVAHGHLCVPSYLLMRIAEGRTGESRPLPRERLERVSVSRIETDHASLVRVKRLTESEREVWYRRGGEELPETRPATTQSPLMSIRGLE